MAKGGFRGGYPGGNQMNMMKQAQKMQQDFLKMQQELETCLLILRDEGEDACFRYIRTELLGKKA